MWIYFVDIGAIKKVYDIYKESCMIQSSHQGGGFFYLKGMNE